ncbi:hypothetical protein BDZ89DRAFT_1045766 [Hymenopellis radicata]|nr:hypothetical protein BDZ89DRAFT_1045766 [Hymenopellis radicata]
MSKVCTGAIKHFPPGLQVLYREWPPLRRKRRAWTTLKTFGYQPKSLPNDWSPKSLTISRLRITRLYRFICIIHSIDNLSDFRHMFVFLQAQRCLCVGKEGANIGFIDGFGLDRVRSVEDRPGNAHDGDRMSFRAFSVAKLRLNYPTFTSASSVPAWALDVRTARGISRRRWFNLSTPSPSYPRPPPFSVHVVLVFTDLPVAQDAVAVLVG